MIHNLDCMCRFVKKQSVPILVSAGVEGNIKQQQQPSWYVLVTTCKLLGEDVKQFAFTEYMNYYIHFIHIIMFVSTSLQQHEQSSSPIQYFKKKCFNDEKILTVELHYSTDSARINYKILLHVTFWPDILNEQIVVLLQFIACEISFDENIIQAKRVSYCKEAQFYAGEKVIS